ncbi:S8 family serine peptidase [Planctomycetaceae bacterium SH139]
MAISVRRFGSARARSRQQNGSRRLLLEHLGSRLLLAADVFNEPQLDLAAIAIAPQQNSLDLSTTRSEKASVRGSTMGHDLTSIAGLSNYSDEWLFGWEQAIDIRSPYGPALFKTITPSPWIEDALIVQFQQSLSSPEALQHLGVEQSPTLVYPLLERQFSTRSIPNDPLFPNQWHLRNTGSFAGSLAGEDANVTDVWDTYRGAGVVVAIVDDGLQHTHPDLAANYRADLSFDYNGNDNDPSPGAGDDHGTAVGGVVAAVQDNNLGVSGAAPDAELSGIRLIAGGVTDTTEATALTLHWDDIHVYNNSWGPFDVGTLNPGQQPGPQVRAAFADAAANGRNGLGSIYLWAGGNGLGSNDDVNYDMYANSRHTIAVGAITNAGEQAGYSESGAPLLVVAHSSGGTRGVTTTDLVGGAGYSSGDYTNSFGGTSSAAPLAAGVVALMLDANANLTSRDVQHVLALSARRNDPTDTDWMQNAAGLWVNHKYGFGAVDAEAAVNLALTWQTVGEELSSDSGQINFNLPIPDNNVNGVEGVIPIADNFELEYVELQLETSHADAGDLEVVLISPSGTPSVMAQTRSETANFTFAHTFTSARNWGESSAGDWTLRVIDRASGNTGTLVRAQLRAYGYSLDSPLPNLTVTNPTVDEAAGTADFVVSIPEAATDLISFDVSTVDISATADEDFVPLTSQSYQIPVGQSQVTVTVSIINDTIEEVAEAFRLQFADVVNADPPFSPVTGTITDDDDPVDYAANPLTFLSPRADLLAHSIASTVVLSATDDVDDLLIDLPAMMPVTAIATPAGGAGTVTIQWLDATGAPIGDSFSSPASGLPAITDIYQPLTDDLYGLRISGDFTGSVNIDFKAGFMTEEATADSTAASPLVISDSQSGFGAFAVIGHSLNAGTVHSFDSATKFVDISATGTALTLGDDGEATITTTVGNSIIPAGSVTIGNNGGIIAGGGQELGFDPSELPTTDFTAGVVPLWTDLFTGGQIFWDEVVIEGKDALVVQWQDKNHYFVTDGEVTFQLQLFDDTAMPLRLVYTDVEFGDPLDDFGASAVIGYQASSSVYSQFSAFEATLTNDSVISFVNADDDFYELDLAGHVGKQLDVVLSGLDGVSFADATLELVNPSGVVVATGTADPTGFDATNFDLAITDFSVVDSGIYTLRVTNLTATGNYLLTVQPQLHETESNDATSDTLRPLAIDQTAIGWLDAAASGGDPLDHFEITLADGERILFTTSTPLDSASGLTANSLDPAIAILDASGTELAADTDSAVDGKNAALLFTAPGAGTYVVQVEAEVGAGVYLLSAVEAPVVNHGIDTIIVGDGTAQRSRVEQVVVTFETEVTIEEGAFEVAQRGPSGGSVDVSFTTTVNGSGQTVASLIFSGTRTTNGRLNDGNYELQIVASKITDSAGNFLDGDGDGVAGGDGMFGAEAADNFFRYYGDSSGDRSVGFSDFIAFRNAFGSTSSDGNYNAIFDVDDDGTIGFADFIQFRNRFGNALGFE